MTTLKAPELLLPAGSLDKMRAAYDFGADAVYAGQPRYSLRARNNEFRLEQIRQEYLSRVEADKTKLGTLMKQYRDMQAHYAPVPQQAKVHDQIVALSDDIKAANKAAWAKAARLLEGKVVLVNQGGGGGTVVVPGETKTIIPPKQIDPNAHPEQVPPPKRDYTHP